jgi:uncharacterized protein YcfJ
MEKSMKKILLAATLTLTVAGCQSAGPNQTVGTGVGALGGYGVARAMGAGPAGSAVGAVAGALIGSEVGKNMDGNTPQPVVVERRYVQPRYQRDCFSVWDRTPRGYIERIVCR